MVVAVGDCMTLENADGLKMNAQVVGITGEGDHIRYQVMLETGTTVEYTAEQLDREVLFTW